MRSATKSRQSRWLRRPTSKAPASRPGALHHRAMTQHQALPRVTPPSAGVTQICRRISLHSCRRHCRLLSVTAPRRVRLASLEQQRLLPAPATDLSLRSTWPASDAFAALQRSGADSRTTSATRAVAHRVAHCCNTCGARRKTPGRRRPGEVFVAGRVALRRETRRLMEG